MVRSPLPSEVIVRHCELDRRLLDFYDDVLPAIRCSQSVLQVGGGEGRGRSWSEWFPDALIVHLTPDRYAARRVCCLPVGPADPAFRLLVIEYALYFPFVCVTPPVTSSQLSLLKGTLRPDGLLVQESPLSHFVKS